MEKNKYLFPVKKIINYFAFDGHTEVDGWLSRFSLSLLKCVSDFQLEHELFGHAVEIGVFHGRFFIALCLSLQPGERALAIDVFEDQHLNVDASGRGDYQVFQDNLIVNLADLSNIDILKSDSLNVKPKQVVNSVGGGVRLFSVDGCHTPEHTLNDLLLASQTLVPGGIIILDDIENQLWPGVFEGARLFFLQQGYIVPVAIAYNKLYLTTNNYAFQLSSYLHRAASKQVEHIEYVDMFGYKVLRVMMPTSETLFKNHFLKFIDFSAGENPERYLCEGWSTPEPWGVWSVCNNAQLHVNVNGLIDSGEFCMVISFHAFVPDELPDKNIVIQINGKTVSDNIFSNGQEFEDCKVNISPNILVGTPILKITFMINNLVSPQEIGISADTRKLGIGLRNIRFYANCKNGG